MKKTKVFLTASEKEEQIRAIAKYRLLIEKELNYAELCDVENVTKWTQSFKKHNEILERGYVIIETAS